MATLSIDVIEAALAERGLDTHYIADEDMTVYNITGETRTLELFDAVSGESYRTEDLTEAIRYAGSGFEEATRAFEDVETVEEFLAAVEAQLR